MIQGTLFCSDGSVDIPKTQLMLPENTSKEDLRDLVKSLLEDSSPLPLDFSVDGKLLRGNLIQLLQKNQISTENVQINCFKTLNNPTVQQASLLPDWISVVKDTGHGVITGCYDSSMRIFDRSGMKELEKASFGQPVSDFLHFEGKLSVAAGQCVYQSTGNSVEKILSNDHKITKLTNFCDKVVYGDSSGKIKVEESLFDLGSSVTSLLRYESKMVATGQSGVLTVLETQRLVQISSIKRQAAILAADCRSNRCVIGRSDAGIELVDMDSMKVVDKFNLKNTWTNALKFSPHSEYLVCAVNPMQMLIFDLRNSGTSLIEMTTSKKIISVDWSHAQRIVAGGESCRIEIFSGLL